ncbi:hypothetical protein ACQPYK_12875 [Streptosporangium sp. CA-135522]|uniref:hypothetical protein n=1 Tax=Streptosporangium sp. CA-135522 TaxID=3240072 RepID=UPI003D89F0B6
MVISPPLPFAATMSQNGDIVVFYRGPEPRMTSEQALLFADQLRDMAAEHHAQSRSTGWADITAMPDEETGRG